MNYKKYTRKFIMLSKDGLDSSQNQSFARGHMRIETGNNKGAIRCQVENMKPIPLEKSLYKLIFMGTKNEKIISAVIGVLPVNSAGKGENYFRFLPHDLDGKGNELIDFTTAIVVSQESNNAVEHQEQEGLKIVLKGEFENADGKKPIKDHVENNPTSNYSGEKKLITYDGFYNKFLLNACIFICQAAETFQDIEPFSDDQTCASWKRISNISNLPMVAPGAHYFAARYKHYIFGAKEVEGGEIIDFYIGIPGRNIPEEQPDGGDSGFQTWQAIKGENSQYGYWIVKILGNNGSITTI